MEDIYSGGILFQVIKQGDLEGLKALVASGEPFNVTTFKKNSPLHIAAAVNNVEILEYLLELNDAQMHLENYHGDTPLHCAVQNGCTEIAKLLIRRCASSTEDRRSNIYVNNQDHHGRSPLHYALQWPDLVRLLIVNGADMNAPDMLGYTPLHLAVEYECLECICMLLYYGANANVLNQFGDTPFSICLRKGKAHIQEVLFDYVHEFTETDIGIALSFQTPYSNEIVKRIAEEDAITFRSNVKIKSREHFKSILKNLKKFTRMDFDDFLTLRSLALLRFYLNELVNAIIKHFNSLVFAAFIKYDLTSFYKFLYQCLKLLSEDQITKLMFLSLQHGVELNFLIVLNIFRRLGHCKLFKKLLFMHVKTRSGGIYLSVPWLKFNLHNNLTTVCRELDYSLHHYLICKLFLSKDLEIFLGYSTHPHLHRHIENAVRHIGARTKSEEVNIIPSVLPKIPSLLQLARDQTKSYIINTFNIRNVSQYYTFVNSLAIATRYKKILKFETKIYDVPEDIFTF